MKINSSKLVFAERKSDMHTKIFISFILLYQLIFITRVTCESVDDQIKFEGKDNFVKKKNDV